MATIHYLSQIEFDHGALGMLPQVLAAQGIKHPFIVTDAGVMAAGLYDRLRAAMPAGMAGTPFTDTPANPTEAAVEQATQQFRAAGCDGLIALGGGSSIDLAKGVAILARQPAPLAQYAAILGGQAKIASAAAMIAVPTTAGTGSEVGRAALITLNDGRKLGFISPHLIPKCAICDPDLTLGLPPGLTAATGMDALTHCIETFLSPRVNPPADAIALDGAQRAWHWIERAVSNGQDREARWQMMMAALQGGLTFQKGLGAVHAMSHPLGGLKAPVLHHGTLNAVILPAVLRANAAHAAGKYERLGRALGLPQGEDLAAAVLALNRRLGMPASLREMGVPAGLLDSLVRGAVADHSSATNPWPMSADDYRRLFEELLR